MHSSTQSQKNAYDRNQDAEQLKKALHYIQRNPNFLPAYTRACELMLSLGHYHQAYKPSKRALKIKFVKKLKNINRASQEWLTNNHGAESYDFLCKKALKENNLKLAYCISKKGAKHFPDDDKFKAHLNKIREFYAKKRDLENALQVT